MGSMVLSPSLQDYLEVILELSTKDEAVRITDIANRLDITKASVNQAITSLRQKEMVSHQSYGPVILTTQGREEGGKIRYRHEVLRGFLFNILGVDSQLAEQDACLMEHSISPQTLERLVEFMEKSNLPGEFARKTSGLEVLAEEEKCFMPIIILNKLSELPVGGSGKVNRISANGQMKKCILEMGLTTGSEVEVKGVAPLGDPMNLLSYE